MSQPEADLSTSTATKWRAFKPVVVAGAALLLGLGAFVVIGLRSSKAPEKTDAGGQKANPAGAVPLAAFVDRETLRWHSVPRGTQVCDGVTFICNGALRTAGLCAARDGKHFPGAVLGVPANLRGTRIHLLQTAENAGEMMENTPYGRMILHYANGESRRFDLLFGLHADHWLQGKSQAHEPVADPNSKPAWVQRRTGDGMIIRLYHTVLENPLPGVTVTTIDFISPLSEANLLLFGLTVDNDPRPLALPYGVGETMADAIIYDSIPFTLQDAAGRPATGASFTWAAEVPRGRIDFPPFPTDAQGRVTIELPRKFIRRIQYQASAPDGSSAKGELEPDFAGAFLMKPVLKLRPAGTSE